MSSTDWICRSGVIFRSTSIVWVLMFQSFQQVDHLGTDSVEHDAATFDGPNIHTF